MDLTIGVLLMTLTLVSVALFLPDPQPPFVHDSQRVHVLMTEGVPSDWNTTSYIIPGFLSDDRFNQTKIAAFEALSIANQRSAVGISSNMTIRFYNGSTELSLCQTCGVTPANYSDALPIRRRALMGSDIILMEVVLYR